MSIIILLLSLLSCLPSSFAATWFFNQATNALFVNGTTADFVISDRGNNTVAIYTPTALNTIVKENNAQFVPTGLTGSGTATLKYDGPLQIKVFVTTTSGTVFLYGTSGNTASTVYNQAFPITVRCQNIEFKNAARYNGALDLTATAGIDVIDSSTCLANVTLTSLSTNAVAAVTFEAGTTFNMPVAGTWLKIVASSSANGPGVNFIGHVSVANFDIQATSASTTTAINAINQQSTSVISVSQSLRFLGNSTVTRTSCNGISMLGKVVYTGTSQDALLEFIGVAGGANNVIETGRAGISFGGTISFTNVGPIISLTGYAGFSTVTGSGNNSAVVVLNSGLVEAGTINVQGYPNVLTQGFRHSGKFNATRDVNVNVVGGESDPLIFMGASAIFANNRTSVTAISTTASTILNGSGILVQGSTIMTNLLSFNAIASKGACVFNDAANFLIGNNGDFNCTGFNSIIASFQVGLGSTVSSSTGSIMINSTNAGGPCITVTDNAQVLAQRTIFMTSRSLSSTPANGIQIVSSELSGTNMLLNSAGLENDLIVQGSTVSGSGGGTLQFISPLGKVVSFDNANFTLYGGTLKADDVKLMNSIKFESVFSASLFNFQNVQGNGLTQWTISGINPSIIVPNQFSSTKLQWGSVLSPLDFVNVPSLKAVYGYCFANLVQLDKFLNVPRNFFTVKQFSVPGYNFTSFWLQFPTIDDSLVRPTFILGGGFNNANLSSVNPTVDLSRKKTTIAFNASQGPIFVKSTNLIFGSTTIFQPNVYNTTTADKWTTVNLNFSRVIFGNDGLQIPFAFVPILEFTNSSVGQFLDIFTVPTRYYVWSPVNSKIVYLEYPDNVYTYDVSTKTLNITASGVLSFVPVSGVALAIQSTTGILIGGNYAGFTGANTSTLNWGNSLVDHVVINFPNPGTLYISSFSSAMEYPFKVTILGQAIVSHGYMAINLRQTWNVQCAKWNSQGSIMAFQDLNVVANAKMYSGEVAIQMSGNQVSDGTIFYKGIAGEGNSLGLQASGTIKAVNLTMIGSAANSFDYNAVTAVALSCTADLDVQTLYIEGKVGPAPRFGVANSGLSFSGKLLNVPDSCTFVGQGSGDFGVSLGSRNGINCNTINVWARQTETRSLALKNVNSLVLKAQQVGIIGICDYLTGNDCATLVNAEVTGNLNLTIQAYTSPLKLTTVKLNCMDYCQVVGSSVQTSSVFMISSIIQSLKNNSVMNFDFGNNVNVVISANLNLTSPGNASVTFGEITSNDVSEIFFGNFLASSFVVKKITGLKQVVTGYQKYLDFGFVQVLGYFSPQADHLVLRGQVYNGLGNGDRLTNWKAAWLTMYPGTNFSNVNNAWPMGKMTLQLAPGSWDQTLDLTSGTVNLTIGIDETVPSTVTMKALAMYSQSGRLKYKVFSPTSADLIVVSNGYGVSFVPLDVITSLNSSVLKTLNVKVIQSSVASVGKMFAVQQPYVGSFVGNDVVLTYNSSVPVTTTTTTVTSTSTVFSTTTRVEWTTVYEDVSTSTAPMFTSTIIIDPPLEFMNSTFTVTSTTCTVTSTSAIPITVTSPTVTYVESVSTVQGLTQTTSTLYETLTTTSSSIVLTSVTSTITVDSAMRKGKIGGGEVVVRDVVSKIERAMEKRDVITSVVWETTTSILTSTITSTTTKSASSTFTTTPTTFTNVTGTSTSTSTWIATFTVAVCSTTSVSTIDANATITQFTPVISITTTTSISLLTLIDFTTSDVYTTLVAYSTSTVPIYVTWTKTGTGYVAPTRTLTFTSTRTSTITVFTIPTSTVGTVTSTISLGPTTTIYSSSTRTTTTSTCTITFTVDELAKFTNTVTTTVGMVSQSLSIVSLTRSRTITGTSFVSTTLTNTVNLPTVTSTLTSFTTVTRQGGKRDVPTGWDGTVTVSTTTTKVVYTTTTMVESVFTTTPRTVVTNFAANPTTTIVFLATDPICSTQVTDILLETISVTETATRVVTSTSAQVTTYTNSVTSWIDVTNTVTVSSTAAVTVGGKTVFDTVTSTITNVILPSITPVANDPPFVRNNSSPGVGIPGINQSSLSSANMISSTTTKTVLLPSSFYVTTTLTINNKPTITSSLTVVVKPQAVAMADLQISPIEKFAVVSRGPPLNPGGPESVTLESTIKTTGRPFVYAQGWTLSFVQGNWSWPIIRGGQLVQPLAKEVGFQYSIGVTNGGKNVNVRFKLVPNVCGDKNVCMMGLQETRVNFASLLDLRLYRGVGQKRDVVLEYGDYLQDALVIVSRSIVSSTSRSRMSTSRIVTSTSRTSTRSRATTTVKPVYAQTCAVGKKYNNVKNCCCAPKARQNNLILHHLCPVCKSGDKGGYSKPCCLGK